MSITIIGLGPGDGRYLTREAWDVLNSASAVYLRTARHPAVADLPAHLVKHSFDEFYETAEAFEDVYNRIVQELLRAGKEAGETGDNVYYAVPGNPYVGEATVPALVTAAKAAGITTRIVPGISFIEPTLAAVGLDGLDGLQLFDALDLAVYYYPPISPDIPLLVGQVYNAFTAGELKLALMALYPEEHIVVLVHGAGTDEEVLERLPLYQIDFSKDTSHLTSLYVPPLAHSGSLSALAETVAYLRGPDGCPWDQEQTPLSIRSGFIEEVAEVLEAIESENTADIREELGDVLFHIVFQAQMASEAGDFTLTEVIAGVDAKLRRRHPHVWGDVEANETEQVLVNWEQLKAAEKEETGKVALSILDNLPPTLPALLRAQKIQKRVKKAGFDWPNLSGVLDKVVEELEELKAAENSVEQTAELGDLLFAVVNWGRWLDIDVELALREANRRFEHRFKEVERLAIERGLVLEQTDLETLDSLWEEAKENTWDRF